MAEVEVPEALRRAAAERDWPEDLIERAAALAVPPALLDQFFFSDSRRESIERQLGWWERLTTGPLRAREATVADNEALADLWANSPIEIGDWEITTERWPNAFAQFRLQENVTLTVLAEHAKLIACVSWSRRNVFVQGPIFVRFTSRSRRSR